MHIEDQQPSFQIGGARLAMFVAKTRRSGSPLWLEVKENSFETYTKRRDVQRGAKQLKVKPGAMEFFRRVGIVI